MSSSSLSPQDTSQQLDDPLPDQVNWQSNADENERLFAQCSSVEDDVVLAAASAADGLISVEGLLRDMSMTSSIQDCSTELQGEGVASGCGCDDHDNEGGSDKFSDALETVSPVSSMGSSKQEFICSQKAWRAQPKHFFILSEAGKPIYSRHGDEDQLSALMAVMQAHVEYVHDLGDKIRAIHSADTTIAFLHKTPLILVAVTKGLDTLTQLIVQLTYLYNQLLSVLTLTQLSRIFEQRQGYDLRKMIGGCERLLDSLSDAMDSDPSFMLSSVRVLNIAPGQARDLISSALIGHLGKMKTVVFAILMAYNQLITLVRMKEYFLHPADLHLIFNLVNSSESFKHSESWSPICLPKFDSSGFMHAHVSYLTDDCPACLVILTTERSIFFQLSEAKKNIVSALQKNGSLAVITSSIESSTYSPSTLGLQDIKHFLFKSKQTAQFVASSYEPPYVTHSVSQIRLNRIYTYLQGKLHSPVRPLKLAYYSGYLENVIAWATHSFELYATFDPLLSKGQAIAAVNKLLKWAKKEENSLFIMSAPTF